MRFKDPITLSGPAPRRSRWFRRITALTVAVPLSTVGALALGELAASAHTTAINGVPVCNTATGTYSIHWTGATDLVPANDVARVEITTHSPAASSVPASPITTTLAPNASYSFDQTGIPGNAGIASVAVHVYWTPTAPGAPNSDTFDAPASGSVVNLPPCNIPAPPVVQQIAGHIYLCPTTPTTTEVAGGTLGATGAQTVTTQANPLAPANVSAGSYTMNATAPAGYTFVACGTTNQTINPAADNATEALTVPAGGSATGIFYVRQIPPPVTCPAGSTMTNGTCVPPVTCPAGTTMTNGTCVPPVICPAGTTMGANGNCELPVVTPPVTCPAGSTMGANGVCVPPVVCPEGTTMSSNGTCTPPVVTPPVGPCPAGTTMNHEGVCTRNVVTGSTTGGATGPVVGAVVPPKKPVTGPVEAPAAVPAALPFTGSNTGALLQIALALMVVGGGLTAAGRRKGASPAV